jgi:predicted PurR-regulated permease PerM
MKTQSSRSDPLRFALILVLFVGVLYVGKSVIVPLALALLLAFILTPLSIAVQRRGVPRVPAVLLVMIGTFVIIGGVGWGVSTQVTKLAEDLPAHSGQIQDKLQKLRSRSAGPFSKLIATFQGLGEAAQKTKSSDEERQQPLVLEPAQSSALDKLTGIAVTVLEPLADTLLILILVAFMLIKREDLRNRVVGLLGHGRLTGTTRVLVESADRISRLLLMQLCVNTSFGIVIGLMLLVIGVPYWFLWGFLTVVLRFVPYVGSWIAAAMPVLLSFATAPGLSQPLLILILFAGLDLVTGNIIEPLLFGHSTGVTPVALLVAALFWTWIWGPIGLILSTPLTVCLVVMGQHVPQLRFMSLLMGDQPPLDPHVAFYQRLLAGDLGEARTIARHYEAVQGSGRLADGVIVPALFLARRDRKESGLTADIETFILQSVAEIIGKPMNAALVKPGEEPAPGRATRILGIAAHHLSEELSLEMLARSIADHCEMQVISTRTLPIEIEMRVADERPPIVFIAIIPPGGVRQARYLCKRLRQKFPELKIVVGYFGRPKNFDRLLTAMRASGASYVTTSVNQSQTQLTALLGGEKKNSLAAATAVSAEVVAVSVQ